MLICFLFNDDIVYCVFFLLSSVLWCFIDKWCCFSVFFFCDNLIIFILIVFCLCCIFDRLVFCVCNVYLILFLFFLLLVILFFRRVLSLVFVCEVLFWRVLMYCLICLSLCCFVDRRVVICCLWVVRLLIFLFSNICLVCYVVLFRMVMVDDVLIVFFFW